MDKNKLVLILDLFNKFLTQEEKDKILNFVLNFEIKKNDNIIYVNLILNNNIDISIIDKLLFLNEQLDEIKFCWTINDLKSINEYILFFLKNNSNLDLKESINNQTVVINNNLIEIKYFFGNELKHWLKIQNNLIDFLKRYLNISELDITFNFDNKFEKSSITKKQEIQQQNFDYYNNNVQTKSANKKSNDEYVNSSLDDLKDKFKINVNPARVFSKEITLTKKEYALIKIGICDQYSAIFTKNVCKKSNLEQNEIANLNVDDLIDVDIDLETSKFDNFEIIGKIKKYKLIQPETKQDEQKRVEFVLHSKMSAYDGIIENDKLKNKLTRLGYDRFAITDRYNVQNYHDLEKTFKKTDIKPIYGVELELFKDEIECVLNNKDKSLSDSIFPLVIFDLETTGLKPNFDEIIEFGAIKINKDKTEESIDFFIKPTKPISEFTQTLTGIKNSDLENAVDEKTGLQKILDFIGDATLIAHNGISFDFNFLQTRLSKFGFKKINNLMIDTLNIARALSPEMSSHRLEKVCKRYKITYDVEAAHRADYDADVLFKCWKEMIQHLKQLNVLTINELINFVNSKKEVYNFLRGQIINVYATNQEGIKNLYEIISIAHTKNYFNRPVTFWSEIQKFKKNLLIANNPIESDVLEKIFSCTNDEVLNEMNKFDFILIPTVSHFQFEIDNDLITQQNLEIAIKNLVDLCVKNKKICCATSNAYYLEKQDEKYYQVLVHNPILNKKPHRYKKFKKGPLSYLRSTEELKKEFSFLNNDKLIQELVIDNTYKIANKISEDIKIAKTQLYPPIIDGVDDLLITEVYKNAKNIYGDQLPKIVQERIDKELNSIITHKFSVVYWVSHLLVKKSLDEGFLVGSRGSVGSSLIATFLKITDVNPLKPHYICPKCKYSDFSDFDVDDGFDLLSINCPKCNALMFGEGHNIPFETFLGFDGDKVPDIDLNFSGLYQENAHNFIKEIFGENNAFRAGTISTIAEKTSFLNARDYFQKIGKVDCSTALINEYAIQCKDIKRTTGQHPGGIIVVPNNMSIFDFTPFNYPANDVNETWMTTHFAFENIHDNLLKFDILGHDNPTILRILKKLTGIEPLSIPHNDPIVMQSFSDISVYKIDPINIFNETTGAISLPEFGTKFVREMLKDSKPNSFSDLVRISGLSHGTDVWINNAQSLISNGKSLKDVIACRDDIMIYLISKGINAKQSFQIMEDVRKGKGIKEDDIKTLKEQNIAQWYIESANKIKYMFPKAHATAYVLHAWIFAWYKYYYPLEYYAAYFSVKTTVFDVISSIGSTTDIYNKMKNIKEKLNSKEFAHTVTVKEKELYSIYEVVLEAKLRGIKFKNIDLYLSEADEFLVDKKDNALICPFTTIDGLGLKVAESIIDARKERKFLSIEDLKERTKISKQHLKSLEDLKCLDDLEDTNQISILNLI